MTKDVFMCLSGKRPAQCGFQCDFCYRADTVCVDYCDKCGREIDCREESPEDYHNPETGEDICKNCRETMKGELICRKTA